jgi:hypothetical protein
MEDASLTNPAREASRTQPAHVLDVLELLTRAPDCRNRARHLSHAGCLLDLDALSHARQHCGQFPNMQFLTPVQYYLHIAAVTPRGRRESAVWRHCHRAA